MTCLKDAGFCVFGQSTVGDGVNVHKIPIFQSHLSLEMTGRTCCTVSGRWSWKRRPLSICTPNPPSSYLMLLGIGAFPLNLTLHMHASLPKEKKFKAHRWMA